MPPKINYATLAKLTVKRPVDRLAYISNLCKSKLVLDIGCFDETALNKRNTEHWLHGRISKNARQVIGIDCSSIIPDEGIRTSETSKIFRGDGTDIPPEYLKNNFDIVVAGEFIEHIENPLSFFKNMKKKFPGQTLLISTPNGACFANMLLGTIGREVQHPDHLHIFSYKILNTLCMRANFQDWEIIPYRFYATEMILQSNGMQKILVIVVERFIRLVEKMFPLLSFGYVVHAKL